MDIDNATIEALRAYIRANGKISNRQCRELLGISYDEAIKLFGTLSRMGVLKRVGVTAGIRYILPDEDKPGEDSK